MIFKKEYGFSTILIVTVILLGLITTTYLVLRPVIFKSKASENKIVNNNQSVPSPEKISSDSAKVNEAGSSASPKSSPPVLTTPDPQIRSIVKPSPKPQVTPIPTPIPTSYPVSTPMPTPAPIKSPSTVSKPQFALNPATGIFNKNCSFSLNIELDTAGNQTDGIDVSLFFDSSKFTVTSIETGTLFENYPPPYFDNQS